MGAKLPFEEWATESRLLAHLGGPTGAFQAAFISAFTRCTVEVPRPSSRATLRIPVPRLSALRMAFSNAWRDLRPPQPLSLPLRPDKTGDYALADHRSLELGKHSHHLEHRPYRLAWTYRAPADAGSGNANRVMLGNGAQATILVGTGNHNVLKLGDGDGQMAVVGTGDRNRLFAGNGNGDVLQGPDGHDNVLIGGRGQDTLIGGNGNDTLIAGSGAGTLSGHGGGDTYALNGAAADLVKGSAADLAGGKVMNFAAQDTIDVTDVDPAKLTLGYGGGSGVDTLSLSDGTHSTTLLLYGNFNAAGFHTTSDGGTGTLVTYTPASGEHALLVAAS